MNSYFYISHHGFLSSWSQNELNIQRKDCQEKAIELFMSSYLLIITYFYITFV